jgi:hypothetical protein
VKLAVVFIIALAITTAARAEDSARQPEANVVRGGPAPRAPGTSPNGKTETEKQLPWTNKKDYQDCGMSCLYEKGNENLSLQAMYIMNKIEALEGAVRAGNHSEAFERLGRYCTEEERNATKPDATACMSRYAREQILVLRKIELAVATNAVNAGRFKNGPELDVKAGPPIFSMLQDPDAKTPKMPQTPYVPKFNELVDQYKRETATLTDLMSADYERWSSARYAKPQQDDYVVMQEVNRDPANKKSGSLMVVKKTKDGKPIKDLQAYRNAHNRWDQMQKTYKKDMENALKAARERRSKQRTMELDTVAMNKNREIFGDARQPIVQAANKQAKAAGIQSRSEMTFLGPANNVARSVVARKDAKEMPADWPEVALEPVRKMAQENRFMTVLLPAKAIKEEVEKLEQRYNQ